MTTSFPTPAHTPQDTASQTITPPAFVHLSLTPLRSGRRRCARRNAGILKLLKNLLLDLLFWIAAPLKIIPAFILVAMLLMLLMGQLYGFNPSRVLSGSMQPYMMTGDYIMTKPVAGGPIGVGEVVTIKGDVSVTHRVIARDDDGTLTTKGDANNTADLFQPTQQDLDAVVMHVIPQPLAGVMALFLTTPQWNEQAWSVVKGDWSGLLDLSQGAPWGVLLLILAYVLAGRIDALEDRVIARQQADDDPDTDESLPKSPFTEAPASA